MLTAVQATITSHWAFLEELPAPRPAPALELAALLLAHTLHSPGGSAISPSLLIPSLLPPLLQPQWPPFWVWNALQFLSLALHRGLSPHTHCP